MVSTGQIPIDIHYKDKNEKFTNVDWMIQKMLQNYLNKYFSNIKVVGEEDMSNEIIKDSEFFNVDDKIDFSRIKESEIPELISNIDASDLCLFIDPVDSTDQFIKRNFGPVTSLLGVALKDEAFIGFINYPFYQGNNQSLTFFNIPTRGLFVYDALKDEISPAVSLRSEGFPFLTSGSRTTDQIRDCI